jgi:hypothetical protein
LKPSFSYGKINTTFDLVDKCSEEQVDYLRKATADGDCTAKSRLIDKSSQTATKGDERKVGFHFVLALSHMT